jgi:hypothetical protein
VTLTPGDRVRVTTTVTVDGLINRDGSARLPFVLLPTFELTVYDARPGAVQVWAWQGFVWIPSRLVEAIG